MEEENHVFLAYVKFNTIRYKLFVSVSLDIFFRAPASSHASDVIRCCIYEYLTGAGMSTGIVESVAFVGRNPDTEKFEFPNLLDHESFLNVSEMVEKYLEGMD